MSIQLSMNSLTYSLLPLCETLLFSEKFSGFFPQLSIKIKSQEEMAVDREVLFAKWPGDCRKKREGKSASWEITRVGVEIATWRERGRNAKGFWKDLGILSISWPLLVWAVTCREHMLYWVSLKQLRNDWKIIVHPIEGVAKILAGLNGLICHWILH